MMSGEMTLSVTLAATTITTSAQSASQGLTKRASNVASAAETNGPITGTKCMKNVMMAMRPA